ncbi:MAG: methylenetetrahydrofolate reductase [Nitrosopumilaceae archaeon]
MTVRYEVNPPKLSDGELNDLLEKLKQKVSEISQICDGIHVTDSVLGTKRVSAIKASEIIRKNFPNLKITISLRVRDKELSEIEKIVNDAIELKLNGVLVLQGDPSPENPKNSGLIPSQVVKHLKELVGDRIDLFLSLPSNPNFDKIQKKIDAKPTGFITQVIGSEEQVSKIVNHLKPQGFKIIPILLYPSKKNQKSADFLKLDWSNYQNRFLDFVRKVHDLCEDVLITSPSDFSGVKKELENFKL